MPYITQIILLYLACINLTAVAVTVADKKRAERRKWRVPEKTLLLIAALGGSPGMLITMRIIRHKIRHRKFMLGIPAIMLLQAVLIFCVWRLLMA